MKKLFVFALFGLLAAPALRAQQLWRSEIGIQGGCARVKPAGTGLNDRIDLFDLPGLDIAPARPSYTAVFAVIPWSPKLAIEPSFSVSQTQQTLNTTLADVGLRLDYALSPKFYGAAGLTLGHQSGTALEETQLGALIAGGYRMHLTGSLRGRVEARINLMSKTDRYGPRDVYALLFGLSATSGGGTSRRAAAGPARSLWRQVIGVSAGYSQIHGIRNNAAANNFTMLSFLGQGSRSLMPPTLFAIFPIGKRLAVEPGFDLHRLQQAGPGSLTSTTSNIAARLDYAIHGGWYAADRKSTRLNSSHSQISYAVFCLKKKKMTDRKQELLCETSPRPKTAGILSNCTGQVKHKLFHTEIMIFDGHFEDDLLASAADLYH